MDAPFAVGDDGTGVGGLVAAVGAILLAVALMRCLYALAMCNAMERHFIVSVEASCIPINILLFGYYMYRHNCSVISTLGAIHK